MNKAEVIKFYLQYRFYIFPAIVALASLFLIIFAIYPQTVKLLENQKLTEEMINKTKFLEDKAVTLEGLDGTDLSQKVGFALSSVPADKDYGNIFDLLQSIVTRSGFTINTISLGSVPVKLNNTSSYGVKLEVRGGKALFRTLLDNFEESKRIVRINSIDISNPNPESADVSLELGVLYAVLPQNFGSADTPLPELSQQDEELISAITRTDDIVSESAVIPSTPRGKVNPFE